MSNPLQKLVAIAILSVLAGAERHACAQFPEPRLNTVFPLGARAGDSVEVEIAGENLEDVRGLFFDDPAIRAFKIKDNRFVVAVAPGARSGRCDVCAIGRFGVSNARAFAIGRRPEISETEPNNDPGRANAAAIGQTINGRIGGELDVDCFAFEGRLGQRILIDLEGSRLDTRVEAALTLIGPDGKSIAENQDAHHADPFLDVTLPSAGRYVLKARDVVYGGSAEHGYRLTIHDGPWVDAALPVVVEPGKTVELTLFGRNLGGAVVPGMEVGGRPIERKVVSITAPAATEAAPLVDDFLTPAQAGRSGFSYRYRTPSGESNPVFLAFATDPVVAETRPSPEAPQTVAPPCDLSGAFAQPGEIDRYRFHGKKGDVWVFEAEAERLGSPADPTFVVRRIPDRGEPQDLVEAEDWPDPGGFFRFPAPSVDAIAQLTLPEDGVYEILIHDLYLSMRGDVSLRYRLNIRRPRPDFRLMVSVPYRDQSFGPRGLNLRAGGGATAIVHAQRIDGFQAPIFVEAAGAPEGVRVEPIVIPAGQNQGTIVIRALDNAEGALGVVRLVGRSRWRERKDTLEIVPDAVDPGVDVAHEAMVATTVWNSPNGQSNLLRLTQGLVACVLETAPIKLETQVRYVAVGQGRLLPIAVSIGRRAGFVEQVNITASGLPPNMGDAPTTIAKDKTSAVVPFLVPANVPPGRYTLYLNASGPYPFSRDPSAKEKQQIEATDVSAPIGLDVIASPIDASVANPNVSIPQGGEVELTVNINRKGDFKGSVTLSPAAPAEARLTADPVVIAFDQTSAKLKLRAAADAPPGPVGQAAVRAIATPKTFPIETDAVINITITQKK